MESNTLPLPQTREDEQEETSEGPLYRVIIHNDNVTPMDFVVHVLTTIFLLPEANATGVMYTAHLKGSAYVQTLPKPEAQKRINKAHFAAAMKNYPLKFTMEPE
jgi:ATP-dependent Clp protease adaptor protein ClpS